MALPASLPLPSYLQHPSSSPLQPLPLSPSLLQLPSPFHLPNPHHLAKLSALLAPLLLLSRRRLPSLSPWPFSSSVTSSVPSLFASLTPLLSLLRLLLPSPLLWPFLLLFLLLFLLFLFR